MNHLTFIHLDAFLDSFVWGYKIFNDPKLERQLVSHIISDRYVFLKMLMSKPNPTLTQLNSMHFEPIKTIPSTIEFSATSRNSRKLD